MPEINVQIPAIGEGLQEARIVAILKQPGDSVKKDETIYQMETDKAVMDVESPYAGTVVRWLGQVDEVMPIGADVLVMEVNETSGAPTESPADTQQSQTDGSTVALAIPQIGEGLQEARLVAKLKNPGDSIAKDEIIYQMETDKAVMDVESPFAGTLVSWLAEVDDVLPIGTNVLEIKTTDSIPGVQPQIAAPSENKTAPTAARQPLAPTGSRRKDVPPRTRAYAKKQGVTDEQLETIPAAGSKLMPEDIDAFLSVGSAPADSGQAKVSSSGKSFKEIPLGSKQRILSSRLQRGSQLVVPGMMQVTADWSEIEAVRADYKASGADFQPSTFTIFAYAVAKAAHNHPIVRSTLIGDSTVRTYENIQLGIAVSLPGDELVVAVVEDANTLSFEEFANAARERIHTARGGVDQANESVTLSITNMQSHGIRDAMAVVVPPGVATIFLGEAHWGVSNNDDQPQFIRCANIGITIDHRLINGVGGADFLNNVKTNVENIRELLK